MYPFDLVFRPITQMDENEQGEYKEAVMSGVQAETVATTLQVTYDETQHCTVVRNPLGRTVGMDSCRATGGKGEEFSPGNLVGAGLAGCMLFSMGVLALRDGLDISGASVDVEVSMTEKRIGSIALTIGMPRSFSPDERLKLERASGRCPIKSSFHPDIPISVRFDYPA